MTRTFSSYGPINTRLHYYVPRQELVEQALRHLVGEPLEEGGHYLTVWAPRQRGKTWIMQQVLWHLQTDPRYAAFDTVKLNLEHLKMEVEAPVVVQVIASNIMEKLAIPLFQVHGLQDFDRVFKQGVLRKPLILILDEFDALAPAVISGLVSVFRNIEHNRRDQQETCSAEKTYLLHGLALIGVRAVLGVDNPRGSPFNIQRNLPIPNLTFAEVEAMFAWYTQESGQPIEPAVIARLYEEVRGQPGLTSWFGELLTETYNKHHPIITMHDFDVVYAAASDLLPNANLLNLINKAKEAPYRNLVIELFRTDEKIVFTYDDPYSNFLYMNGIIEEETIGETQFFARFPSPFVQKRLFNSLAREMFQESGALYPPFTPLTDILIPDGLHIVNLLRLYERYVQHNRDWLFKDAPRKANLRLYEAVYHFNLYMYLWRFLEKKGGHVHPEFPTGNGQIDLLIQFQGQRYGLELKSYTDDYDYRLALQQAARYGQQLELRDITLVFFVDAVDATTRARYETLYQQPETGVTVQPLFIITGL